jgi:hypothetical protein
MVVRTMAFFFINKIDFSGLLMACYTGEARRTSLERMDSFDFLNKIP